MDENKDRSGLPQHGDKPVQKTPESIATWDKQNASGNTIQLRGCTPWTGQDAHSRGNTTPRSQRKQAATCIPATQPVQSRKLECCVLRFPFGGWTRNNTIPSVIKISTQGSRVLHTRGTPAHTGDDIKGRNRNGRGNRDGIIGFKKKGHS